MNLNRFATLLIESFLYIAITTFRSSAVPVDNGVEGSPEIVCSEGSIGVRFRTRNPFEGHVFVKNRYADRSCRADETGQTTAIITLPFSSCGVRRVRSANPKGVYVDVTVVISFHPQFVTKVDRAYTVQCFYMEAEKSVTAELEVSMLTTIFQTEVVQMPVCRYEVLQEGPTGLPVKYAKVGDRVYHKWTCATDTTDMFCMTVHSCFVNDGTGDQIQLLDGQGCALDKYLLNNLEFLTDLMAGRESHVFKYADKPSLYFNCQVTLAVKEPGSKCTRTACPEPQRGKRNARNRTNVNGRRIMTDRIAEVDVNSDFLTILDLDSNSHPNASSLFSPDVNQIEKQNICVNIIAFGSTIAGVLVLLSSLVCVLLCLCRRLRKQLV